jgi:hypothetical protein
MKTEDVYGKSFTNEIEKTPCSGGQCAKTAMKAAA